MAAYRFRIEAQFHFIKGWRQGKELHETRFTAEQEMRAIAREANSAGLTAIRIVPVEVEIVKQCTRCHRDIDPQGLCGCKEGHE